MGSAGRFRCIWGAAVLAIHISTAGHSAATDFFRDHGADPTGVRKGGRAWLANDRIGLEFLVTESGMGLSRLYGTASGHDFVAGASGGLSDGPWQLIFRRDRGRDEAEIRLTGRDGAKRQADIEQNSEGVTLRLRWVGLTVGQDVGAVDVEVRVAIRGGDPLSRWRIAVANRSKTYGLWSVRFPVLELVPIGGKDAPNIFTVPRTRGIVAKRPFRSVYTPAKYPGGCNMQFQAFYDNEGTGLYFAAEDGDGHRKHFHFDPDRDRRVLRYAVEHFPANMGYPGEDYTPPYDICIGPFAGDWYDACQIYRTWAIKQRWCSQGPLATRRDIPRWYKESPLVATTVTSGGDEAVRESLERVLALQRFMGRGLPVIWYAWKQHFPEMTHYNHERSRWRVPEKRDKPCSNVHDGNYPQLPALTTFADACRRIAEAGGHVKPYVCAQIYDQGLGENAPLAAEAKPNTRKNLDGGIKLIEEGGIAWGMCYGTPWWRQRMKETVTALIENEGAAGIYFDTFYGGRTQCFDVSHGHSHGGGNHAYLSARKLSRLVRGAMKEADPESVMSGENPAETAIDLLDGFLYARTIRPDNIPMLATVYGDYISRFGRTIRLGSDGLFIQCASLFTEGAQIGRLPIHWRDYLKDVEKGSPYTEHMRFLRRLAGYWQADVGARYLAYGQLLRPIAFATPAPMPTASYQTKDRYKWKIAVPALMSAAFLAPDGRVGVFVVNVTDRPLESAFKLAADRYPIQANAKYRVTRISQDGEPVGQTTTRRGAFAWEGTVGPHDVAFVEAASAD